MTLVELLVVLLVLLTVITAIVVPMTAATTSEVDLSRRVQGQQEARLALDRIRADVHCAYGVVTTPAWTPSSVTIDLPSGCFTGSGLVTWCTLADGARWTLRRAAGSTCTSAAPIVARHLTTGAIFLYTPSGSQRATLGVTFPIQVDAPRAPRPYQLDDKLVFRNTP